MHMDTVYQPIYASNTEGLCSTLYVTRMSSVNKLSGMRTPRSARSDSTIQSIEEDFDIEEDELSGANDLLKSDNSQVGSSIITFIYMFNYIWSLGTRTCS